MPDRDNTCMHKALEQMTTQQLDGLLAEEFAKEKPNAEVVLPILRLLEQREKDTKPEITPEIQQAWEAFQRKTEKVKKPACVRAWVAGIAAAVALVCLLVFAVPRSANAENLFERIFRWTQSVFQISTPEQDATNPPVTYVFRTDNPGLQQLYDKMVELGIDDPVVPMWLPAGSVLLEIKVTPLTDGTKVSAKFDHNGKVIMISYRISDDIIPATGEKDDTYIEVIEIGNVKHAVMENENNLVATWKTEGVSGMVYAELGIEDIRQVIKSIYKRELS